MICYEIVLIIKTKKNVKIVYKHIVGLMLFMVMQIDFNMIISKFLLLLYDKYFLLSVGLWSKSRWEPLH